MSFTPSTSVFMFRTEVHSLTYTCTYPICSSHTPTHFRLALNIDLIFLIQVFGVCTKRCVLRHSINTLQAGVAHDLKGKLIRGCLDKTVECSAFAHAFMFVLFLSDYFVDYSLVLGSAYLAVYHTH